ncbi:uncharacterized protein DUF4912 [Alicyclobacillus sacchari]|uniref:Uncharacterized protein DUF4912 n=1 Tax=Alicyclobacillus sacchari TaxID=392010 RepID=A0A4R8LIE5_9BACL|nr:uncharacterized protein DUF4912 [Alicyclobacillus sacchari]
MEHRLYNEDWNIAYQRSRMVGLPVHPTCLFAYWFMTDDHRRLCEEHWLCDWSNMPLSICVYDVTGVWFDGHNAPLVRQEIIQPTDTTNWYIHNLVPGRHYVVDLTLERDGERFSLLRSNMVSLPPLAKHGAQPDLKFASPFVTTVQTAGLRISDIASRQDDKGEFPISRYAGQFDGYHLTR